MKKIFLNLKELLKDRKKRFKTMFIVFIPFLLLIVFFGFRTYKEATNVLLLVKGNETVGTVSNDYLITTNGIVLRDSATSYQKEIFKELKESYEKENELTSEDKVALTAKNFIADFYTLSNKNGQYDVGGIYYINVEGKENAYTKARDTFYKYVNEYQKEYGKDNLPCVENVECSVKKLSEKYPITTIIETYIDHYNTEKTEVVNEYELYEADCSWVYVTNDQFPISKWPTSTKVRIIFNESNNTYEVVSIAKSFEQVKEAE